MSVIINTNSDALRIQGTLTGATNKLSETMQRMSSGLKINSAKDDAAGTVISARMAVQLDGNLICQKNVQNANALLSTVEGNVDVVLDNVSRIRDLTLQAKNGTYSTEEIQAMQDEVAQRIEEINRVSQSAKYSQLDLFGGSIGTTGLTFQVGTNATANDIIEADGSLFKSVEFNDILTNDVDRVDLTAAKIGTTQPTVAANFLGVFSDSANLASTYVNDDGSPKAAAVDKVFYNTKDGSFYIGTSETVDAVTTYSWSACKLNAAVVKDGEAAAAGDIGKVCKLEEDGETVYRICTNYADDTATYSKALTGFDPDAEAAKGTEAGAAVYSDSYKFDLTTMKNTGSKTYAQAINALDKAIDNLTSRKSLVGSLGNRLDSALDTLTTQNTNLTSAKSIITDADIASEAATYTQNQILQQVSTSLLAQANQAPSIALSLL